MQGINGIQVQTYSRSYYWTKLFNLMKVRRFLIKFAKGKSVLARTNSGESAGLAGGSIVRS